MSNFIDELSDAVKRVASSVSNEVTIAAREQKLREAYQKLGRMTYQAHLNSREPKGPKFDAQVFAIEDLLRQIEDLRRQDNVTSNASDEDFEENP